MFGRKKRPPLQVYPHQVLPGDPRIKDCVAETAIPKPFPIKVDRMDDVLPFKEKDSERTIVSVVGPIACRACAHNCNDAFITFTPKERAEVIQASPETPLGSTKVTFGGRKLGPPRTERTPAYRPAQPPTTPSPSQGPEPNFVPWELRCKAAIADDILALRDHPEAAYVQPEGGTNKEGSIVLSGDNSTITIYLGQKV